MLITKEAHDVDVGWRNIGVTLRDVQLEISAEPQRKKKNKTAKLIGRFDVCIFALDLCAKC
jgi:hypothetical protein